MIVFFLVILEHFRTLAPSTFIIIYSGLIKGLFGGVTLRTEITIGLLESQRAVFIGTVLATSGYAIVTLLECVEKRRFLKEPYKVGLLYIFSGLMD